MVDIQSRAYKEQYGLNYVSVIPTNIYGPNDNFDLHQGHVMPMLIHKCYIAKQNGTDLNVWGTGNALREFIYSEDIAKLSVELESLNRVKPSDDDKGEGAAEVVTNAPQPQTPQGIRR